MKEWFPGFMSGSYDGAPGVGAKRVIRYLWTTVEEMILVWDEPSRWTFRVDRATVPLARALIEDWEFEPHADGTLARWTFAADTNMLYRLIGPLQAWAMARLFKRAMRNLAAQLGS